MERTEEFRTLYEDLLFEFNSDEWNNICTFFIQVGHKYRESKKKILFVGKSVNSWISDTKDVDILFSGDENGKNKIINRPDEISWIMKPNSKRDNRITSRTSQFWRVIGLVSKSVLEKNQVEKWYEYIAWSNLYKVSPYQGGNPTEKMKIKQRDICCKILDKEIEILQPQYIVFLTSRWERFYLKHINLKMDLNRSVSWESKKKTYITLWQKENNLVYIQTLHPQGKAERAHAKVISEIINNQ